jgi:hypothetical protein
VIVLVDVDEIVNVDVSVDVTVAADAIGSVGVTVQARSPSAKTCTLTKSSRSMAAKPLTTQRTSEEASRAESLTGSTASAPVAGVVAGARKVTMILLGNLAYWNHHELRWDPKAPSRARRALSRSGGFGGQPAGRAEGSAGRRVYSAPRPPPGLA